MSSNVVRLYTMNNLLKGIEEYQDQHNLNDKQFAKLAGISPAMVSLAKSGNRKFGRETLISLAQIPELKPEVLNYLNLNAVVCHHKPPEQRGTGFTSWIRGLVSKKI